MSRAVLDQHGTDPVTQQGGHLFIEKRSGCAFENVMKQSKLRGITSSNNVLPAIESHHAL